MVTMNMEKYASIDRVYYEWWLYGQDVYNDFAQYCFWQNVFLTQHEDYILSLLVHIPKELLATWTKYLL